MRQTGKQKNGKGNALFHGVTLMTWKGSVNYAGFAVSETVVVSTAYR